MKKTSKEIIKKLEKEDKNKLWYLFWENTKAWKTRAQKNTFELLFWIISKYHGYHRDEIKIFFLIWCFWEKYLKMWDKKCRVPIVWSTMDLTKEQGIFFIDTILEYIKIQKIPFTLTTREVKSLYNSYK